MAEQDDAQKTEEPTQKKLEDAHKKGQVPKSQEVRHTVMLAGIALTFTLFAAPTARELATTLSQVLGHAHSIAAGDPAQLRQLFATILFQAVMALGLPFTILAIAALAGNMVQHKPVLAPDKIKPKLEKISPVAGAKRLFSMNALMEFSKSLAKLVVVGAVAVILIWPERARLEEVVSYGSADLLSLVFSLALRMMAGVVIVMTIIAALDFMFQRFQFHKQQRMTKQEVKDEHKQLEGDPQVKMRLRQVRQERTRKRMMAAVPESTVVITNPTHYAVALKYEAQEMDAPIVVAKGTDKVAWRIRERAEEYAVPIVENPPLARALFDSVEVEEAIPPEQYKAVAEVIGYVMKLKKRGAASWRRPAAGDSAWSRP